MLKEKLRKAEYTELLLPFLSLDSTFHQIFRSVMLQIPRIYLTLGSLNKNMIEHQMGIPKLRL